MKPAVAAGAALCLARFALAPDLGPTALHPLTGALADEAGLTSPVAVSSAVACTGDGCSAVVWFPPAGLLDPALDAGTHVRVEGFRG